MKNYEPVLSFGEDTAAIYDTIPAETSRTFISTRTRHVSVYGL